jgi:hypothetical protein
VLSSISTPRQKAAALTGFEGEQNTGPRGAGWCSVGIRACQRLFGNTDVR